MFAAIQKWPSGLSGASATAARAAVMPDSRYDLRSRSSAWPPSQ